MERLIEFSFAIKTSLLFYFILCVKVQNSKEYAFFINNQK